MITLVQVPRPHNCVVKSCAKTYSIHGFWCKLQITDMKVGLYDSNLGKKYCISWHISTAKECSSLGFL